MKAIYNELNGYAIYARQNKDQWLNSADELHQKCIWSECGTVKLYYIDLWLYKMGCLGDAYQPEAHFTMPGDNNIRMTLVGDYTVAEVESEFSRLYRVIGAVPYGD